MVVVLLMAWLDGRIGGFTGFMWILLHQFVHFSLLSKM